MNFSPTIYPTNSSSLTGDVVEAGGPEPVHPSVGTGHPPRPPGRVPPRRGGEGAPGRACAERVWRRGPAAAEVGRRRQQQQQLFFATGEAFGLRDIPGIQACHRGETSLKNRTEPKFTKPNNFPSDENFCWLLDKRQCPLQIRIIFS